MPRAYDNDNPGDAAAKTTGQRARQGQNITGMMFVLGGGLALVIIAYAITLALSMRPVTVDNMSKDAPAASTEAPATETAKSPL